MVQSFLTYAFHSSWLLKGFAELENESDLFSLAFPSKFVRDLRELWQGRARQIS